MSVFALCDNPKVMSEDGRTDHRLRVAGARSSQSELAKGIFCGSRESVESRFRRLEALE